MTPHFILARVRNAGRRPIVQQDFESNLKFGYGSGASILDAQVRKRRPSDLTLDITSTEHEVTVMPGLLNPRDYLEIGIWFDGEPKALESSGRIAGVRRVTEALPGLRWPGLVLLTGVVLALGGFINMTVVTAAPGNALDLPLFDLLLTYSPLGVGALLIGLSWEAFVSRIPGWLAARGHWYSE